MSAKQDFLKAIWEQPHDDLPRLVYADWLEEQGDGDRAEFIRLQCEYARTERYADEWKLLDKRIGKLWKQHRKTWQGELHSSLQKNRFERGFVSPPRRVYTAEEFIALDPEMIAGAPSWKVEFRCHVGDLTRAAFHPFMSRVSELTYNSFGNPPKRKDAFFASGDLRNIGSLTLNNPHIDDVTVEEMCIHHARYPHLSRLSFGTDNRMTDKAYSVLEQSPLLHKVTECILPRSLATAVAFHGLLESGALSRCQHLYPPACRHDTGKQYLFDELDDHHLSSEIMKVLSTTTKLPKLQSLSVDYRHQQSILAFLETAPSFQLQRLQLWTGTDAAPLCERLGQWAGSSELRVLIFSATKMNTHTADQLVKSPYLNNLKFLHYSSYDQIAESQKAMEAMFISRFGTRIFSTFKPNELFK